MPAATEGEKRRAFRLIHSGSRSTLGKRKSSSDTPERDSEDEVEEPTLPPAVGPRKKGLKTDSLVHHGRHFGRTVQMFGNINNLIHEGVLQEIQLQAHDLELEDLPEHEKREHELFSELMRICGKTTMERLFSPKFGTHEFVTHTADSLTRGVNGARSDDLKTMKAAVIEWITPEGGVLIPPLTRNVKTGRGFYHDATGAFLCPTDYDWDDPLVRAELRSGQLVVTGLQWPRFLYRDLKMDPENPWEGLFRSAILVLAYKHVFISPSSASGESRATRAGNAQIHGMTSVTPASLAYVATILRFSLGHWNVFNRNDKQADSERFYSAIVDFFEDDGESEGNPDSTYSHSPKRSQIFPTQYECGDQSLPLTSALAHLKRRNKRKALGPSNIQNQP
ncbi:hypothetical protein NMY22_g13777 [Coprinellus aureogranulatus]|nr:hypothetical protein NMY22_g13777 [Coprinellus aureogranulatus]